MALPVESRCYSQAIAAFNRGYVNCTENSAVSEELANTAPVKLTAELRQVFNQSDRRRKLALLLLIITHKQTNKS